MADHLCAAERERARKLRAPYVKHRRDAHTQTPCLVLQRPCQAGPLGLRRGQTHDRGWSCLPEARPSRRSTPSSPPATSRHSLGCGVARSGHFPWPGRSVGVGGLRRAGRVPGAHLDKGLTAIALVDHGQAIPCTLGHHVKRQMSGRRLGPAPIDLVVALCSYDRPTRPDVFVIIRSVLWRQCPHVLPFWTLEIVWCRSCPQSGQRNHAFLLLEGKKSLGCLLPFLVGSHCAAIKCASNERALHHSHGHGSQPFWAQHLHPLPFCTL